MRLLCVLCLLCGCALSALALDREAFTITKYDLDVRLEPEQQRLGVRGKITLRNDSAESQKVVALQISSSLNWRSIRAGGQPVQYLTQPYESDIDHTGALSEALVTLPAAIKPKESVEVEIGYEGVIPLDGTRLTRIGVPESLAKHTSWDQISKSFTAVRGAGYVAWYPITTESADFSEGNSLFEVVDRWKKREAESEFKVALNSPRTGAEPARTLLCGSQPGGSSRESGRHESEYAVCAWTPLGTVTPTFAMAEYTGEAKPPLRLFSLSGHETGARTYSAALDPAAEFVTKWFGKPNAPVAIADFADPHAAPFESGTLLLASMAADDSKLAGINLVHELTHSAVWSPRPWVYEGLAHFAEAMYREQQGGREAALDLLGIHRATFVDQEKDVAAAAGEGDGQPLATTFDEIYYRSKAAYVWWMLRDLVGDQALKAAIGKYRAADDKDPKYVEQLVSSVSKRDVAWFFDDWVYHDRGLPDLRVQSAHPWKSEKAAMITVTLENLGNAGAEVPLTVRCEGGDITTRLAVRAKGTATTRVELPGKPLEIVVNDGSVPESDLGNNVFRVTGE
jgi:hypothetical protein